MIGLEVSRPRVREMPTDRSHQTWILFLSMAEIEITTTGMSLHFSIMTDPIINATGTHLSSISSNS